MFWWTVPLRCDFSLKMCLLMLRQVPTSLKVWWRPAHGTTSRRLPPKRVTPWCCAVSSSSSLCSSSSTVTCSCSSPYKRPAGLRHLQIEECSLKSIYDGINDVCVFRDLERLSSHKSSFVKQQSMKSEWKLAKIAAVVIVVYVLSWAPYACIALIAWAGWVWASTHVQKPFWGLHIHVVFIYIWEASLTLLLMHGIIPNL